MKLPDLNVLLYATNADSEQHDNARTWLESAFRQPPGVGFAWVALLGFIRLTTRSGIMSQPLSVEDALSVVQNWLSHPAAHVLSPTDRHAPLLGRLLIASGAGGNLTTDAHLAALAIEHSATLGSFDRDFMRFTGLDLELLEA